MLSNRNLKLKKIDMSSPNLCRKRILSDNFLILLYRDQLIRSIALIDSDNLDSLLEIGAAGGITKDLIPSICTTDVRPAAGVDKVIDAQHLSDHFSNLGGIIAFDTLHHIRNPREHFDSVNRVLRTGGQAIYMDPNWNHFSIFIFKYLLRFIHPEPYDKRKSGWDINSPDVLIGNQAAAYNIFKRDLILFKALYPKLQVEILQPFKSIAYLISGGVSTLMPWPKWFLIYLYKLESKSSIWNRLFGLSRLIRITKIE